MVRFQGLNSTLSVAGFKVQGLGEGSWVQEREWISSLCEDELQTDITSLVMFVSED